jgi:hypothetical protein
MARVSNGPYRGGGSDAPQIVDDREEKGSLLITSQIPIGRWHEIIGVPPSGMRSSILSFTGCIGLS